MPALYKRGQIWWVKFYHRGQVIRRSTKTSNRQLARERGRLLESSIKDGNFTVAASCTQTRLSDALGEFCMHLRSTRTAKAAQTEVYRLRQLFGPACPALQVNARKPIAEAERKRRLAAMKPSDLRPGRDHLRPAFVEDLTTADVSRTLMSHVRSRKLSPKTGNRMREVLHRFCQWCISQRGVRFPENENPVAAVERLRETASTIRFLTLDDVRTQLDVLRPHPPIRAMVGTYIYAGLRREEALWLTHDDIDLAAAMIRVRAKTVSGMFWEPKTKLNRAVPISKALAIILADHEPIRDAPWFFTSPRGCQWDPDNFAARLRWINASAGLPWSCLDFRHTFGSLLAQRGVSLFKISELMGNSPEICRRHYAALIPEQMADVVEFDTPPAAALHVMQTDTQSRITAPCGPPA